MKLISHGTLACVLGWLTTSAWGGDWPQFRYDAGRTAATPDSLPEKLQLRWVRTLPAPRPAFPHEVRLAYDASYEPVVSGHTIYVPSMVTDSVTAYDTRTGVEKWHYITEGPVRFAPVAAQGKIYFVSDDGYLYCLGDDGSLRWKFRGTPAGQSDRTVLGHGRLISLRPARGGPVLANGVVYFAAGLWPTEGVFIHAVDAETGKPVWSNTECSRIPECNWDHGQGQVAGLTPQGYLAVVDERLIVPCGPQLPAFMDRKTGKLATYTTGWGGRIGLPKGCWFVAANGRYLSHAGDLYDITRHSDERLVNPKPGAKEYKPMLYPGGWTRLDIERANQRELDSFTQPVLTPEVLYESDNGVVALDLRAYTLEARTKDKIPSFRSKDELPDQTGAVFKQVWKLPSKLDVHIKAGARLYVGGPGAVEAIDASPGNPPKVAWHADIEGTPHRMLAADNQLFVVTTQGRILAFAAAAPGGVQKQQTMVAAPSAADAWTARADSILKATGKREGYAVVLGIENGRLVEELIRQSSLHVIAVTSDAAQATGLRERLTQAGYYGTRASVHQGEPLNYPLPPYLAELVVADLPQDAPAQAIETVYRALRPYGGIASLTWGNADRAQLEKSVLDKKFAGAKVRQAGDRLLLERAGALPGAADWSHAEANADSAGASQDELRSPNAVLWYDAAQRWHKFPGQNQVRIAGGRLFLLEEGRMRAADVFTGRKFWEVDLSGAPVNADGAGYAHHRQWGPKANISANTEFVAVNDAIYLCDGPRCLQYSPATGKQTAQYSLPEDLKSPWANLRVSGEQLIGSSGDTIVCVHRRDGKLQWRYKAERASLYLAVGGGKVYCAELGNANRGEENGKLLALNLANGEQVWQRAGGDRLRYSQALDMVVTPAGFYRGADGEPLPQKANATRLVIMGGGLPKTGIPGVIAGERLLTGSDELLTIYDLKSAQPIGDPLKWARRGCTSTRASTNLLTTRFHANSAWIDLESKSITPVFGIRPGCSVNNNMFPADGVLSLPNLTAGCTCNYAPVSMACVPNDAVAPSQE